MTKDFPSDPDFDLIRQFLPQLNKTHDELHRMLPRYRELCRKFRRLLLYVLPGPFDADPLAEPPNARRILLDLRDKIEAADDLAAALRQLETFNAQMSAVCGSLAAWADRKGTAGPGH